MIDQVVDGNDAHTITSHPPGVEPATNGPVTIFTELSARQEEGLLTLCKRGTEGCEAGRRDVFRSDTPSGHFRCELSIIGRAFQQVFLAAPRAGGTGR